MTTLGRPLKFTSARERVSYVLNNHPMWASRLSIKNGLIAIIWVSVVAAHSWYMHHHDATLTTASTLAWQISYIVLWVAIVLSVIVALWMILWTVVDVLRWRRAKAALSDHPERIAETLRDNEFRIWLGRQLYIGRRRDLKVAPRQLLLTAILLTYHDEANAPRWLRRRIATVGPYISAIATQLETKLDPE